MSAALLTLFEATGDDVTDTKLLKLQELCQAKKQAQTDALPKEWLLPQLPPKDQLNVMDIPRSCGLLNEKELQITETSDVKTILQFLAKGTWSSLEVTTAFLKRAIIAHQLTNCLTEFWIEDALARARELDAIRSQTGPVGPLHGLPVSLKDQFDVEGKECTMGIASWIGRISQKDAALVQILRQAGAVIYVRTNVPQTLMRGETDNFVFGLTTNPHNRSLTCGGSSGGEGALIALRGSVLGIGTDIGGSVRIPAAFNGLCGLRPTMRRMPYGGASNTLLGLEAVESVIGPLSPTVGGCALLVKSVMEGNPWDIDQKVVELHWREEQYQLQHLGGRATKLTFAVMMNDNYIRPHPTVLRALKKTIEALKGNGHQVIEWNPKDLFHRAFKCIGKIYDSDGGQDFKATFAESGEPLYPGTVVGHFPGLDVYQSWQLNKEKDALRQEFLDQWMSTKLLTNTSRPIDALICPQAPYPAPPHGTYDYVGYTAAFNLLDYPATIIPVTTVSPTLDVPVTNYEPLNEWDERVQRSYSPEIFKDAPVCVQIVGRRFREEELLGISEVVEKVLQDGKN
ncbi:amidase signature domain-containing protein [Flagelloscypha sp. PMI_526]|nr:amidase signature domain-containing protein [Flagelloscypha sp. PMI_526]